MVTVTDSLPAGLSPTAIAGTGWTCTLASVTCTRSDALAAPASYPAIVVTVSAAANASGTVVNMATVSGGSDVNLNNNTAMDQTSISNIGQTPQTISFVGPTTQIGPGTLASGATASSGLTVTLTSNTPRVCSVSGTNIVAVAVGTCSITATQPGNTTYAAATPVTQSFPVTSAHLAASIAFASGANPSSFGHPLSLTANVTPSTATGNVTFFDGSTILGTGTLTNGSTTISTSLLASGARSLKAFYAGDLSYPALRSAAIAQSNTALTQTGFAAGASYATGAGALSAAAGDFNGDGKPDLAVANTAAGSVSILAGNGDGTFTARPNVTAASPGPLVTADFDGDGRTDVAFASNNTVAHSASVGILLGNGDGTFRTGSSLSVNAQATNLAVADFNGDGIADIAVSSVLGGTGSIGVLLGNGDGTFHSTTTVTFGDGIATGQLAVGDFNGDGIADLVVTVASGAGGSLDVLLGNGDGTFQAPVSYATGLTPVGVIVADFNGDGRLDLAAAVNVSGGTGQLAILLGVGNGTFQTAVNYPLGSGLPLSSRRMRTAMASRTQLWWTQPHTISTCLPAMAMDPFSRRSPTAPEPRP